MTLLKITGLTAGYGNEPIIHDVDINLTNGELVALIGPNGAGKSTVLKSVFGLTEKIRGSIKLNNRDITDVSTHELLGVGVSYVPQGRINFTTLTVEENLLLGAKNDQRALVDSVYKQFPVLQEKSSELAYSLSGGEQQMLAMGRALMQNPSVLLLDEPSLGLSPSLVKEVFAIIDDLRKKGISLIVVEQNAKKAIEMADHTYLLENGRVVLSGKNLDEHPKIKEVYLGGDTDD